MKCFYSARADIDDELLSPQASYSLHTVYEDAWQAMYRIIDPLYSFTSCIRFTRMV